MIPATQVYRNTSSGSPDRASKEVTGSATQLITFCLTLLWLADSSSLGDASRATVENFVADLLPALKEKLDQGDFLPGQLLPQLHSLVKKFPSMRRDLKTLNVVLSEELTGEEHREQFRAVIDELDLKDSTLKMKYTSCLGDMNSFFAGLPAKMNLYLDATFSYRQVPSCLKISCENRNIQLSHIAVDSRELSDILEAIDEEKIEPFKTLKVNYVTPEICQSLKDFFERHQNLDCKLLLANPDRGYLLKQQSFWDLLPRVSSIDFDLSESDLEKNSKLQVLERLHGYEHLKLRLWLSHGNGGYDPQWDAYCMKGSTMKNLLRYGPVLRLETLSFSTKLTREIVSDIDEFLRQYPEVGLHLSTEGNFGCLDGFTEIPKHLRTLETEWSPVTEVNTLLDVLRESPAGCEFEVWVNKDCVQQLLDARPNVKIVFHDMYYRNRVSVIPSVHGLGLEIQDMGVGKEELKKYSFKGPVIHEEPYHSWQYPNAGPTWSTMRILNRSLGELADQIGLSLPDSVSSIFAESPRQTV